VEIENSVETMLVDIGVMQEGLENVLFVSLGKERSVAFGGTRKDFWSSLLLHASLVPQIIGLFSNRTGTSVDDGARRSNNCLDQWQSGKLGTRSRL